MKKLQIYHEGDLDISICGEIGGTSSLTIAAIGCYWREADRLLWFREQRSERFPGDGDAVRNVMRDKNSISAGRQLANRIMFEEPGSQPSGPNAGRDWRSPSRTQIISNPG